MIPESETTPPEENSAAAVPAVLPDIVGPVAEAVLRSDDGQVVLVVVGTGVFALAPLGKVLVIADAHDRRPARFPAALPGIILRAGAAVVGKSQGVADFVADGLGGVFFVSVAEVVFKYERGRVAVPIERADVGHAADVGSVPSSGLRRSRPARPRRCRPDPLLTERRRSRILRGHVHVERKIILGHALPDGLDRRQLRIAEGGVGVHAVSRA